MSEPAADHRPSGPETASMSDSSAPASLNDAQSWGTPPRRGGGPPTDQEYRVTRPRPVPQATRSCASGARRQGRRLKERQLA